MIQHLGSLAVPRACQTAKLVLPVNPAAPNLGSLATPKGCHPAKLNQRGEAVQACPSLTRQQAGFTGCGKSPSRCHSERSEESLLPLNSTEREILRRRTRLRMTINGPLQPGTSIEPDTVSARAMPCINGTMGSHATAGFATSTETPARRSRWVLAILADLTCPRFVLRWGTRTWF